MSTTLLSVLASGYLTYKNGGGGDVGDTSIAPNYQKHSVQISLLKTITFINLRILPKDQPIRQKQKYVFY